MTPTMARELTATGGVLIMGLGLSILEVRSIRVGALLPALLVSIALTLAAPVPHTVIRALGL